MFIGIHAGLAMLTQTDVWLVTQAEGDAFMAAAQNVMRHYPVTATQKTIDWIAFSGVTANIYGMRIAALWLQRERPQRPQAQRGPATVHPFPPPPGGFGAASPPPPQAPMSQTLYEPSVPQPDFDDAG